MRFSSNIQSNNTLTTIFENPLDKFRLFNYHHIWAISSDTTTLLDTFNDPSRVIDVLQNSQGKDRGGYRNVKNKLAILINTAQDADFVIDTVQFKGTVTSQSINGGANPIPDLNGSIDVTESQGVRLLNVMRQIFVELQVGAVSATHCLKTVFVGWEGASTQPTYILDIPPIFFSIQGMKMSVTHQGSKYAFDFQHNSAIGKVPAVAQSGKGILLRMGGNIRDELNSVADQYTKHARDHAESIRDKNLKPNPMKYRIELDSTISEIGNWTVTDDKSIRTEGQGKTNSHSINGDVSIEEIIGRVIEGCKTYLDQFNAQTPDSFVYKIIPSQFVGPAGEPEMLYRITKFKTGKIIEAHAQAVENTRVPPEDRFGPDARVLIYDYIFTGKNTDIEDLDLRVDEGLNFFQAVTNINSISDKVGKSNQVVDGTVASAESNYQTNLSSDGAPSPINTIVAAPQRSTRITEKHHPIDQRKVQYDELSNQFASILGTKMGMLLQIRGNPGWMTCFAIQPDQARELNTQPDTARRNSTGTIFGDMPWIYVNIMMPTYSTAEGGSRAYPEFEPFWYQGLWNVLAVNTIFNNGRFYQELSLLAMPVVPQTKAIERTSSPDLNQPANESKDSPGVPPPSPAKPHAQLPGPDGRPRGSVEYPLETIRYTTQITSSFTFGSMLKTNKVNWQRGENDPTSQTEVDNIVNTLEQLQKIRDKLGSPITITSGYRGPNVNSKVGGAKQSDHLSGMAADFVCPGFGTPKDIVNAIISMGIPYKQLILENPPGRNGWVHIAFSRSSSANKNETLSWYGGNGQGAYQPYTKRG